MKILTTLMPDQIRTEAVQALQTSTNLVAQMTDPRIRHHQKFLEGKLAWCQRNLEEKAAHVRGECVEIIEAANRLSREVQPKVVEAALPTRGQAPKTALAKRQQEANRIKRRDDDRARTNVQKGLSPTHVKQKGKK